MKQIFSPRFTRLMLLGAFLLVFLYFLYLVRIILFPFILAIILAYVLNPLVSSLEQFKIPRVLAISIVYLTGISSLFLLVTFGIPIINQELNEVSDAIPGLIQEGQQCVNSLYSKLRSLAVPESIGKVMDESFKKIEAVILREMRQLANSLMGLFSQAISIFLAPILAFYILKDWNGFSRKIMFFPPAAVRDDFISLWAEIDDVLMCFIRGHLIVAILVAVFSALGLKLVGMNYVLLLSIIIGIMELIPYFGPIIGSVFAISLALLKSKTLGVYVFIVMVVIQQLESNIISPAILGESVGLHPIMIIFALLAGGKLFGFIGLLLAVPVSAVLKIIMGHVFSLLAAR